MRENAQTKWHVHPGICDMHVHSTHSADGRSDMQAYCEQALAKGVKVLCFTEHFNNHPNDVCYGTYDPDAYFEALRVMQARYAGALELLAGLEFAEPQEYPRDLARLRQYPYDCILGSQHFVGDTFLGRLLQAGVPPAQVCDAYWTAMDALIEAGGIDMIAHFDFPKRYLQDPAAVFDEARIRALLRKAIAKGIGLEINTSPLRNGRTACMPGPEILEIYVQEGGTRVTLGSDAHHAQELAAHHAALMEQLPASLCVGIFRQHRFVPMAAL